MAGLKLGSVKIRRNCRQYLDTFAQSGSPFAMKCASCVLFHRSHAGCVVARGLIV